MIRQRQILLSMWLGVTAFCAVILLFMSFSSRTSSVSEALPLWNWLLLFVGPTLGLMISTFVKQEQAGIIKEEPASSFLFKVCIGTSAFYLALPIIGLLTFPFGDVGNPLKWLNRATVIKVAIQSVSLGALAYFFYGEKAKDIAEFVASKIRPNRAN